MRGKILKITCKQLSDIFKENRSGGLEIFQFIPENAEVIDGAVVDDELRLVVVDESFDEVPDGVIMPDFHPIREKQNKDV